MYPVEKSVGCRGCAGSRCKVCENINATDTFTSFTTKITYKISHSFGCNDKYLIYRGVATGGPGGPWPHTPISKPKKVQQFQFQTSGILSFTVVQKLCGPEISRFLPCMLQILDNLR